MAQPLPVAPPVPELAHDHIVVLSGVSWADYQRILEIRGDKAVPRVTYLRGELELMSPSISHESIKSMIGCLVEAWCFEKGVDISPYGSWTHESKQSERGVEPDECYVLGDVKEPERCDLAIEVVWTSGGVNRLDVYRKLDVREVWSWKAGAISVHELQGEAYAEVAESRVLKTIDLGLLVKFIDVKPMTRAVREYRAALRGEAPERT